MTANEFCLIAVAAGVVIIIMIGAVIWAERWERRLRRHVRRLNDTRRR